MISAPLTALMPALGDGHTHEAHATGVRRSQILEKEAANFERVRSRKLEDRATEIGEREGHGFWTGHRAGGEAWHRAMGMGYAKASAVYKRVDAGCGYSYFVLMELEQKRGDRWLRLGDLATHEVIVVSVLVLRNVADRVERETCYATIIGDADNPERPQFQGRHEPEIFEAWVLMYLLYLLQGVVAPPVFMAKVLAVGPYRSFIFSSNNSASRWDAFVSP